MSTPIYDLQKVKEALNFTEVRMPNAADIKKIKDENFQTFPTSDKGNGSTLPAARESKDFNGQFLDDPLQQTRAIRDALVRNGSIFFSMADQGIDAANADNSAVAAIRFDLILSENHELTAKVCEHPVQNGSAVTDHIQPMPARGSLKVLVTDYSIKDGPGGWRGNAFDASKSRAKETHAAFKTIFAKRMLCTLVTVLDVYEDVVLTRVSAMRDGNSGEAQEFDVEFTQIRRANLATATLPAVAKPANMLNNKNRKAAPPAVNGPVTPDDLEPSVEGTFQ